LAVGSRPVFDTARRHLDIASFIVDSGPAMRV
jgi:hypothetical protein